MAVAAKALDQLPPKSLLMEKLLDLRYKYELELATAAFTDQTTTMQAREVYEGNTQSF